MREAVLAYYFGVGAHADVFRTALRGPNILQNLLGEQTLSASFIPVYSRFLAQGREEDAGRFAGAILGLLLVVAGTLALAGVLLARPLVAVLAPGYLGDAAAVAAGRETVDRLPLAVTALRIIFPMTGILVLSAWALGVLNSHRRFFLSYVAPVLWNAAIIAALFIGGALVVGEGVGPAAGPPVSALDRLLIYACVGALVGGLLQFAVQLPFALRLLAGFRLSLATAIPGVVETLRTTAPLAAGRGVVQLAAFLDLWLASLLAVGAQGALGWGQTLYMLPISLFGMSIAAAELPELARRAAGGVERPERTAEVAEGALRRMAFLTVPSCVGYLAFGYLVVGVLFRRGSFGIGDNWLVYLVLCGYSLGLLATTSSRLLANVFYARGETRRPARIAVERVAVAGGLGAALMFWLDRYSVASTIGLPSGGNPLFLGAVGLSTAAGIAAWVELVRLRTSLRRRLPDLRFPWRAVARMLGAALGAVAPAAVLWWLVGGRLGLVARGALVLGCYAAAYLLVAHWTAIPEAEAWIGRWLRRSRGGDRGLRP